MSALIVVMPQNSRPGFVTDLQEEGGIFLVDHCCSVAPIIHPIRAMWFFLIGFNTQMLDVVERQMTQNDLLYCTKVQEESLLIHWR